MLLNRRGTLGNSECFPFSYFEHTETGEQDSLSVTQTMKTSIQRIFIGKGIKWFLGMERNCVSDKVVLYHFSSILLCSESLWVVFILNGVFTSLVNYEREGNVSPSSI